MLKGILRIRGLVNRELPCAQFGCKSIIVGIILALAAGYLITCAHAFEIKPPSKLMSPSEREAEFRTTIKIWQEIFYMAYGAFFIVGTAVYWFLRHTADIFVGFLVMLSGYFLLPIPRYKERNTGSSTLDLIKGKVGLSGSPRHIVMSVGALIALGAAFAQLFGHSESVLASILR